MATRIAASMGLAAALVAIAAAGAVACKAPAGDAPSDADAAFAADGALRGDVSAAYAEEVDSLCDGFPLGALTAKPTIVDDADIDRYLREQIARAGQARTKSLLARMIASPAAARGSVLRSAFLQEAKPLLPKTIGPSPGAPTAPWGHEEPMPRTDWGCALGDRLDKLAR